MNKKKDAEWKAVVERYREHPIAIEALELLERVMKGVETIPIPEGRELIKHYDYDERALQRERRLQALPVERMSRIS